MNLLAVLEKLDAEKADAVVVVAAAAATVVVVVDLAADFEIDVHRIGGVADLLEGDRRSAPTSGSSLRIYLQAFLGRYWLMLIINCLVPLKALKPLLS